MTLQECYGSMGADYDEVIGRLRSEERVQKFLLKVLDDKSYELLLTSLEEKNIPEAFRAAHTLKGISQNLSLTALYHASAVLSDVLRDRTEYGDDIESPFEELKDEYERSIDCISQLKG